MDWSSFERASGDLPENALDYLRANKLVARVWESFEDITDACADAWNGLIADPDRIRSLGARTGHPQGGQYQ
jgi:hypothetical protein